MPISFSTAMIDAYSVPWAPDTMASTGPGRAPWTTATGMLVAASDARRHFDDAGRLLAARGARGADGEGLGGGEAGQGQAEGDGSELHGAG